MVNDDPELLKKLTHPAYKGRPEHAIVFTIEVWDINCPQHIKPRFTAEEIDSIRGWDRRLSGVPWRPNRGSARRPS